MRRKIRKQVWLSEREADELARKSMLACLDESALIRELIKGYEPAVKPDEVFYQFIGQLEVLAESIGRIADVAYATKSIDAAEYETEMQKIHMLARDIEAEMIQTRRSEIWKEENDE